MPCMHKKCSDMHEISSDGSYVGQACTLGNDNVVCILACNGHDGFEFKPSGGVSGGSLGRPGTAV